MKNALLKGLGVLTAAVALCSQAVLAGTVYDNTSTRLPARYGNTSGFEFGDEIILAGGPTIVTNFAIEYFGTNFFGDEEMRVRIYAMTGPTNVNSGGFATPGTTLYDSGNFNIAASAGATLTFDNLVINAPERITWTVEFGAVGAAGGEVAGLNVYSPPTLGNNFNDFWQRSTPSGAWELRTLPGGTPGNFGARFTAVPEPSTFALSGLALLGLAAYRRSRRS